METPTEYPDPKSRLIRAKKIGLIGDIHGDLGHLLTVLRTFRHRDIDTIVQLGDLGLVWPQAGWVRNLSKLDRTLARLDQTLYWLDGNHEDHPRLTKWSVSPDGIRWLRDSIGHLPRGFRTTLSSGKSLAVLGGANSIDVNYRSPGTSWWPEESITDADLQRLGNKPADILLGHDAPLRVRALDAQLNPMAWTRDEVGYANAGRAMFHRGFLQVQPALCVSGHYHCHVNETRSFRTADGSFRSRIVVLDTNGSATKVSQAILDVDSLELEFLTRNGAVLNPRGGGRQIRGTDHD